MGKSTWVNIIERHKLEFLNRANKVSINDRVKRRIKERVETLADKAVDCYKSKFLIFGFDPKSLELVDQELQYLEVRMKYSDFDTNTQKRIEADALEFMRTLHRELKKGYKVNE